MIDFKLSQTGFSDQNVDPPVYGRVAVSGGQVAVQLLNFNDMSPWGGNGSWYAVFGREDGRPWLSKAAIDFTANRCPTKNFSDDFKPYAYSFRLGEVVETGTPSMTLDDFLNAAADMNYAAMQTQYGKEYRLYKNEAMTQEFSGTDPVNANTVLYCPYPIFDDGGESQQGERIGQITGSITLTNVPAAVGQRPTVKINVFQTGGGEWHPNRRNISLSGISGGSGTVNWIIPLYEDDEIDSPKTVWFGLDISYPSGPGYHINISEISHTISETASPLGNIGTASLAAVKLSGTISVTYNGSPVPYVYIQPQGSSYLKLENPGPNTPWGLYLPPFASPTTVTLQVVGSNTDDRHGSLLFTREVPVENVQNTDISGIDINLGDITP
jgi:hypothetical protein